MLTPKQLILIVIVLITLKQTKGLNESSQVEDNEILRTKSIIGNTTNKIFTSLKLKGIKEKPIVKHYSLIHSYFVSLTLQDYNNLKQIVKFSRVDKKVYNNKTFNNRFYDNRTASFIDQVIEILNNDCNTSESNDSKDIVFPVFNYTDYVVTYFDSRFKELEYHLHFYRGANTPRLDINKDILAVLNDEARALNGSDKIEDLFDTQFDHTELNKTVNTSDDLHALDDDSDTWMDSRLSGRRIFNGIRTRVRHFPFMASIEIFEKFTCGGSIISEDIVVTAASCLQLAWNNRFYRENPKFIRVRIGSNYFAGGGDLIPVLELFFYPTYNPKTLSNNIAMIRLSRKIKFKRKEKDKVKRISFDKRESPLPMNVDGITIVGWGAKTVRNTAGNPWSNKISYAVLEVYPLPECQEIYSKEYVTTTNFCAGFMSRGSGACNKDIGGPGIVSGVLTGIISFGSPKCGTPNSPTVFTKVGYYSDWIEDIVERVQTAPSIKYDTTLRTTPIQPWLTQRRTTRTTPFVLEPIVNEGVGVTLFPQKQTYSEPTEYDLSESFTESIPTQTKSAADQFKEFLKTMFDSKEIADYLRLDAEERDTNLSKDQEGKHKKKKDHTVTTIDADVMFTPLDSKHKKKYKKHKNKKKHNVIPITALDYNQNRKTTSQYDDDDLMQAYDAIMNTALGFASPETTKKHKKSTKNTVKLDSYEDYSTEKTTKRKKKKTTLLSTTTMQRQTLKVTHVTPKIDLNNEMVYTNNVNNYDYDSEYQLISSQEKLFQKLLPPQEQPVYLEPAKQALPKQVIEQQKLSKPALVNQAMFDEALAKQALADEAFASQVAFNEAQANQAIANEAAIFNDNNYGEDDENGMSIDPADHDGIKAFNDKEIIDTKELEIDLGIDIKVNNAEKKIDARLKDYILGPTFNGDVDTNQGIEEINDYGDTSIGDDVDFDMNDVVLDQEEYPVDHKGGLWIAEKMDDIT